ncbi:MAG: hypothetical protein ACKV2V_25290 [Blastocatellia bacterium]
MTDEKERSEELPEGEQLRLADVTEDVDLPGEAAPRGSGRKKLLMLAALTLLAIGVIAAGWWLLRGKKVEVRTSRKTTEKVTSGADL